MGTRILVTGATGFIGGRVAAAAAAHPDLDHVRLLVRRLDEAPAAPAVPARAGRPVVETVQGDLRDAGSLRRICDGVDVVLHCASAIGGAEDLLQAVNEHGARDLVDAARRAGATRIVSLSTASVLGRGPFRAADPDGLPLAPGSVTSRTRAAGERYVLDAGGTVLRPHLVYGTGDRMVVPGVLTLLAALPGPLAGGSLHSMVEVESLAGALLGAALSPATRPGAYCVAHPDPVSDAELLAAVEPLLPPAVRDSWGPAVEFAEARALLAGNPVAAHHLELFGVDHWFADERPWTDFGRGPGPGFTAAFPRHLPWYRRFLSAPAGRP